MATKNNPHNRGVAQKKMHNGKEIEPVMYVGKYAGHGNYISAQYCKTTELICDEGGKPMNWKDIANNS